MSSTPDVGHPTAPPSPEADEGEAITSMEVDMEAPVAGYEETATTPMPEVRLLL